MMLSDMVTLILAMGDIPEEGIQSAVIDDTYVTSYRTPQGSDVLVLQNPLVALLLIDKMFAE